MGLAGATLGGQRRAEQMRPHLVCGASALTRRGPARPGRVPAACAAAVCVGGWGDARAGRPQLQKGRAGQPVFSPPPLPSRVRAPTCGRPRGQHPRVQQPHLQGESWTGNPAPLQRARARPPRACRDRASPELLLLLERGPGTRWMVQPRQVRCNSGSGVRFAKEGWRARAWTPHGQAGSCFIYFIF